MTVAGGFQVPLLISFQTVVSTPTSFSSSRMRSLVCSPTPSTFLTCRNQRETARRARAPAQAPFTGKSRGRGAKEVSITTVDDQAFPMIMITSPRRFTVHLRSRRAECTLQAPSPNLPRIRTSSRASSAFAASPAENKASDAKERPREETHDG